MKIAIIYFSKTGRTRAMAEVVADALKENFEASKPMFRTFGERVAQKAKELFEPGK